MKLLIDTNVLIPLEPTRPEDVKDNTGRVADLVRVAGEGRHQIYVHPAAKADIDRDTDDARRKMRHVLYAKYPELPNPPRISASFESSIGTAEVGSNDWVDHLLICAVAADAADFVVTEDRGLRAKAKRLALRDRVLSIEETTALLRDLSEQIPSPPPAVNAVRPHVIDLADPILSSLRGDYAGFDDWFKKARRQHRPTLVIEDVANRRLAALCIVNNEERDVPEGLSGKVLKICTFKVSADYNGYKYGELLLKALFDHGYANAYDWAFVTVFEKHDTLIELFEDFGFGGLTGKTDCGELILAKRLRPLDGECASLAPLEFHIKYGPRHFRQDAPWFLIPIKPEFCRVLFPETEQQITMFDGQHPFGNALRKAYLCHSPTKSLPPGAVLVFYRSQEQKGVVAVGICESTCVSSSPAEILRLVGKRTVYNSKDVDDMVKKPVLAILFRQSRILAPAIRSDELVGNDVMKRPPQSIMALGPEGIEWLKRRLVM
jgi:L-amino acid N-acyltransferase YncA